MPRKHVLAWRLVRVGDRTATGDDDERLAAHQPGSAPEVRLTSAEQSAVRHRLNLRAEWSHEEATALNLQQVPCGGPLGIRASTAPG